MLTLLYQLNLQHAGLASKRKRTGVSEKHKHIINGKVYYVTNEEATVIIQKILRQNKKLNKQKDIKPIESVIVNNEHIKINSGLKQIKELVNRNRFDITPIPQLEIQHNANYLLLLDMEAQRAKLQQIEDDEEEMVVMYLLANGYL